MLKLIRIAVVLVEISLIIAPALEKYKEKKTETAAAVSFAGEDDKMEDQFAIEENIEGSGISLYGVFDGHAGKFAAEYTSINLFVRLKVEIQEQKEKYANYGDLLKEVIKKFETELNEELSTRENDESGTCATIALINGEELYVANVGDSRAVLGTENGKLFGESKDHTKRNTYEFKRVKDAGGDFDKNGYILSTVEGGLIPTRSLGDRVLKSNTPGLIAEPEIMSINLKNDQIKFIILATDGLWDVVKSKDAVKFINDNFHKAMFGAELLVWKSKRKGSMDDITVMVIKTNQFQ